MDTTTKILSAIVAVALALGVLLHGIAAFLTVLAARTTGKVQALAGLAAADLDKAGTLLETAASAAGPLVSLVVHAATGSTVNVHAPPAPDAPAAPAAAEVKS